MITLTIPATPPSWNTFYAGTHHWKRKKLADLWHGLILSALTGQSPKTGQVNITVTVNYPDRRRRDPDNICAKLLIDGLVKAGILPDDSDTEIGSVTTRITRDRDRPRETVVTIEAA